MLHVSQLQRQRRGLLNYEARHLAICNCRSGVFSRRRDGRDGGIIVISSFHSKPCGGGEGDGRGRFQQQHVPGCRFGVGGLRGPWLRPGRRCACCDQFDRVVVREDPSPHPRGRAGILPGAIRRSRAAVSVPAGPGPTNFAGRQCLPGHHILPLARGARRRGEDAHSPARLQCDDPCPEWVRHRVPGGEPTQDLWSRRIVLHAARRSDHDLRHHAQPHLRRRACSADGVLNES